MKPPTGAITDRHVVMKLVAKAKVKPVKIFLVWFTDQKWTLTTIIFTEASHVHRDGIHDAIIDYQTSTSCSFTPVIKDHMFASNYWYFRNYWFAYGYLCQMKTKSPDHY